MPAAPKPVRKKKTKKKKTITRSVKTKRIKKRLHDLWSKLVRHRDKACVLCGESEKVLNAHHWIVNAGRSLSVRFCLGNGVTLCYSCHIFKVHQTAAAVYTDKIRDYMIPDHISMDDFNRITVLAEERSDFTLEDLEVLEAAFKRLWERTKNS